MSANTRQIGGKHYQELKYQHWDWVCDVGLPYLLGCATKYVARWKDKGGVQDLEKAIHYLEKAKERGVFAPARAEGMLTIRFADQLPPTEALIVLSIARSDYAGAAALIQTLVKVSSETT